MAPLIRTFNSFDRTSKFFLSHCSKQFLGLFTSILIILTNFFLQNVQGLSTGHKTFLRNRNWSPNKKVMTDMVILYHFLKGLFEQCDIKSLEDSCTTWVSVRALILVCLFLYRYEVAKTKIGRANKAFICPKFQNTVSNFAKCNSVTFLKSFRFSQFLSSMVMLGTYHIYLSVVKSNDSKKQIAPFLIRHSIL